MARHYRLPYAAAVLAVTCSLVACGREDTAPGNDAPPPPEPTQEAEPVENGNDAPTMIAACEPEKAQWAIGENATEEVLERIRTDTGARVTRPLKPGQPATMDYRPDRVNVVTDDEGVVLELTCG